MDLLQLTLLENWEPPPVPLEELPEGLIGDEI